MGPTAQEQTTLHQELGRLEDVIAMLESRLINQSSATLNGIEKNPESIHVLDNVRTRITTASIRLEGLLQAVQTL